MMILRDHYHERHSRYSAIKPALLWIRQMQQHPFLMSHQENSTKKYSISICAIFKDEAPYLAEWLEHHLKIGIEHFYMYDNNSSDEYMEKLDPYLKREDRSH